MKTASAQASSERLKRRWEESPEIMQRVLASANAQASKRNKTRWEKDREKMLAIAIANAAKGTEVLTGSTFTPERRARHSAALKGRVLGGEMAKGPANRLAKEFGFRSPSGEIFHGKNMLDFIRSRPEIFSPADVVEKKGTCNAAKQLSRVHTGQRAQWKGWTRHPAAP